MKLRAAALFMSIIFIFSLSGCDIGDLGVDSLLRPPKTMGDEAEIEQLIAKTAKSGYTLKYPKSGNNRSAIVMIDLDNDEIEEAVAFYKESNEIPLIHMLVMYSDNKEWKLSADITTESTDVDSVDFADIDGDSTLEILSGYTTYSPNINRLSCSKYSDGKTGEIKSGHNYSSFYCGDFDSDGTNEIMALVLFGTENEASATLLDYSGEKNALYSKAIVKMDPNITKYKSVTVADFENGTKGVVVDGAMATDEMNTQVIFYNPELVLLRNPLFDEKKGNVTRRTGSVVSRDIDSDGFVEIPIVSKLPYEKSESLESVADKIIWNSFSTAHEDLAVKRTVAANSAFSYTFKMSDKWQANSVTARIVTQSSTMDFYTWENGKLGGKLFVIKVFDIADWEIGKETGEFLLITKDDRYAYAFENINTKHKLSLTNDEIKTAFSVMTETVV